MANGITNEDGTLTETTKAKEKKGRILGKTMMSYIYEDMDAMVLPSWVTRVPRRVGSFKDPTGLGLGADEWRSFGTINLVTTLINKWGPLGEGSREYALLANFMDLVTAVKLSFMRITTPERRTKCREYTASYLQTLLDLFPGTSITSNQHLCLHIPDLLEAFGPGMGLSTWPGERAIGDLQDINTNNRMGQ